MEEEGQEEKKLKENEVDMVKVEHVNQTCVELDNLPPEMLVKIVENLDFSSLLSSRQLNRKWNEMASELLRSQTGMDFVFTSKNRFKERNVKKSLRQFTKCFQNSMNFPFASFYLKVPHSQLNNQDFESFLFHCKNGIRSLKLDLDFKGLESLEDFDEAMRTIEDLLLNKLLNLTYFGLDFITKKRLPDQLKSQFQLYPKTTTNKFQLEIQLPHLQVISLSSTMLNLFPGIVQFLLVAAANLKRIEPFEYEDLGALSAENAKLLHSIGKLHLLHSAEILPSSEFFSWIQTEIKGENPPVFQLSRMSFNNRPIKNESSLWPQTAVFLNWLLNSVKNTLTTLLLGDLTFLNGLQFPKFTKLKSFDICSNQNVIFPCGFNRSFSENLDVENANFPVVDEIDISAYNLTDDFCGADPILSIPSVRRLRVFVHHIVGENVIKKMAILCLNLKKLDIGMSLTGFITVAPSIWTHMENLQSLKFTLFGRVEEISVVDLNAAFTGISKENCQILVNKMRKMDKKPMPMSKKLEAIERFKLNESEIQKMRENVSILNLKGLKILKIQLLKEATLSDWEKEAFFHVSRKSTFDMMPKTTVSIKIN